MAGKPAAQRDAVEQASAAKTKGGLEGIVAGKTELSYVDGANGRLSYRGIDIHDLAREATFEEVAFLLWYGHLPNRAELEDLTQKLAAERQLPGDLMPLMRILAARAPPMEALRTVVSALASFDADVTRNEPGANLRKAIRVTAKMSTALAAYHRLRQGHEPVAPKNDLGHASNFIYMLKGTEGDPEINRIFDMALVLHADHGFNASTFAARVTASTLSDMHSALTSAIGTLKGPLHGGANEQVMHLLEEIESPARAKQIIDEKLAAHQKIPGFGHRIYKTLDPRAPHLKEASETLGKRTGNLKWYEMSTQIQKIVKDEKGLDANVDFYSASVYHSMGIATDLFTPIFALSRVSGWSAHVIEQLKDNRLIRPDADYVGPMNVPWVPISKRV